MEQSVDESYIKGWDMGWDVGYEDGREDGYKSGHNDGYADGYDQGYGDGPAAYLEDILEGLHDFWLHAEGAEGRALIDQIEQEIRDVLA